MSVYAGPEIIDNSMILCVDAGNSKSYPGSGTSWYDLSGNNYTGTLTNGPTYDSSYGGSIVFDGTNDIIDFGTPFDISTLSAYTLEAWVKINSLTNENPIIVFANDPGATGWQVYMGVATNGKAFIAQRNIADNYQYSSTTFTTNSFLNIVATWSSNSLKLYVNGVSEASATVSVTTNTNKKLTIGGFYGYFYSNSNIYLARIYNKVLSNSEINSNYYANRSRFKPTPPTGGTITLSEGYRIHTFTSSSTFATNDFGGQVDYLIVGGGGGGGGNPYHGGGGGAGGLLNSIATLTTGTSYTVTVGGGGAGITGTNGNNSSFNSQTGVGGGGGGNSDSGGSNGGSGGGCGVRNATVGTGTSGQGNNGGAGVTSADFPNYGAGGGGGRGSTGANGTTVSGGDGGTGALVWGSLYAGGGGGSAYNCACSGAGGSGIGGAGAFGPGAGNGSTNTGSGGGGRDNRGAENKGSGNGGSGIVIIRYKYPF